MTSAQRSTGRFSRRTEVIAWAMYDWANSAYSTILITVLHGYLTKVVFEEQAGATVYALTISASMLIAALLSPVIGALADANRSKRKWLAATAFGGAGAALLMACVPPDWSWLIVAMFACVSLGFELSLGFYNAFLPEIADEKSMDMVSAWGFAFGYLGGSLPLILAVAVMQFGPQFGIPAVTDQLRIGLAIMGLWWGLFTVPTIVVLRDRGGPPLVRQPFVSAARKAASEVGGTLQNIRRYGYLALFLLGFLLFNEGVQTVLSQASTYAQQVPELSFKTEELIGLVLMIQFLALPGALVVGWLANRLGQKRTLIGCLAVWVALLVCAYFVNAKWQFWILGAFVAMVMGGTQSVSRSIMGMMTPPSRAGEFFGFFNFSGKATSFLGPALFAAVLNISGNPRMAIISLLVFFVLGSLIVSRVRFDEGRRQALEVEPLPSSPGSSTTP
jgi:UMF1 family MFS transporter